MSTSQSANSLGITFNISQIKGQFDADVQEQCEAALSSLKESQRLYQIAVGAVRDRSLKKLNVEWSEMRIAGRKLEDELNRKLADAQRSENLARSFDNTLRSATLALNEAKAVKLPKRPTVQEIAKHHLTLAKAEAAVTEARQQAQSNSTRHQRVLGSYNALQTEMKEFEAKERDLANKIKSISGQFPDHYVVATARNQHKVADNSLGLAQV